MSVTFTKLFSSITASTVWCESSDTRVVWITMLAMSDRWGRVWASIPGLAKEAAVSVDAARAAIDKFLSPDPDSRTKVAEGRRIVEIDGGWKLINHAKYRAIRDEEERRAYKTEKQREYRSLGQSKTGVDASVDNVDKGGPLLNGVDPRGHNAEADTEANTDTRKTKTIARSVPPEELAGTLPLVDGSLYSISKSQVSEWREAYPGIDVKVELKKFKAWLDANPTRKKTHKGIARATVNWLGRAQDNHGGQTNGNGSNGYVKVSNAELRQQRNQLAFEEAQRILAPGEPQ